MACHCLRLLLLLVLLMGSAHGFFPFSSKPDSTLPTTALVSVGIPVGGDSLEPGASTLSERLFHEAFRARTWRLIERDRVDAVFSEQALQMASGSCGANCAELGNLLGAQTLLVPSMVRQDSLLTLSLREVDVASGEVLRMSQAETVKPLSSSAKQIARLLIGRLLNDPDVPATDSATIQISASPDTMVWVDGRQAGKTPLSVTVWPGEHQVSVVTPVSPQSHSAPISAESSSQSKNSTQDNSDGDAGAGAAVVIGGVAAVAGVALIAASASMPDSVWKEPIQHVDVDAADTVQVQFTRTANQDKKTLAGFGIFAALLGVIVVVIALQ